MRPHLSEQAGAFCWLGCETTPLRNREIPAGPGRFAPAPKRLPPGPVGNNHERHPHPTSTDIVAKAPEIPHPNHETSLPANNAVRSQCYTKTGLHGPEVSALHRMKSRHTFRASLLALGAAISVGASTSALAGSSSGAPDLKNPNTTYDVCAVKDEPNLVTLKKSCSTSQKASIGSCTTNGSGNACDFPAYLDPASNTWKIGSPSP